MNEIFVNGLDPSWMTKKRAYLIPKDKNTDKLVSSYKPNAFFNDGVELLTRVIIDELYGSSYSRMDQVKFLDDSL